MLQVLLEQVGSKYDYLLSKIAKLNTRAHQGHTRDGWQIVEADDRFDYVLLRVDGREIE